MILNTDVIKIYNSYVKHMSIWCIFNEIRFRTSWQRPYDGLIPHPGSPTHNYDKRSAEDRQLGQRHRPLSTCTVYKIETLMGR